MLPWACCHDYLGNKLFVNPLKCSNPIDTNSDFSSQSVSISWWHAHSRAVVLHTLHKGQRDTRLRPFIYYRSLGCTLTFAPQWESSFTSLCHSSYPPPSSLTTAAPMPLLCQSPLVTTTASLLAPPDLFTTPHTGVVPDPDEKIYLMAITITHEGLNFWYMYLSQKHFSE